MQEQNKQAWEEQIVFKSGGTSPLRCFTNQLIESTGGPFRRIHYHEHIEILYGISGKALALVGNQTYSFGEGDMLLIYPKEAHDVIAPDGNAVYHVIQFLPKLLYSDGYGISDLRLLFTGASMGDPSYHIFKREELAKTELSPMIENIMQEWKRHAYGYELVLRAEIMKLFVRVLRMRFGEDGPARQIPVTLHSIFEQLTEYAQTAYAELDAKKAADFCHLSYSYFCRSFKQSYGMAFSEYMEILRLREGERLLLTTDKTVTEISGELGFSSTSYFVERFRLRYRVSPHAFRLQMKNSVGG